MDSEPKTVVGRISEIQQKQRESGELVKTPNAIFKFPYLSDEKFLNSPVKDKVQALNLPETTITAAYKAIEDLGIESRLMVTTLIPKGKEKGYIIPSQGIGGRAIFPSEARFYFDPSHPAVFGSLRIWGARRVGHELTHIARYQANKRGETLLDALISEGLATYYEKHWGGEYLSTPWGHALNEQQLGQEWKKAQHVLGSRNFVHDSWFFGTHDKHPVWTGYSLGTKIVNGYFQEHPEAQMQQLVKMNSTQILRDSRSFAPGQ